MTETAQPKWTVEVDASGNRSLQCAGVGSFRVHDPSELGDLFEGMARDLNAAEEQRHATEPGSASSEDKPCDCPACHYSEDHICPNGICQSKTVSSPMTTGQGMPTSLPFRDPTTVNAPDEMTPEQAIDIIARHAIAHWAEGFGDDGDWEGYPEVGENDWNDIAATIQAAHPFPTPAGFDEAYAVLAARAERGGK